MNAWGVSLTPCGRYRLHHFFDNVTLKIPVRFKVGQVVAASKMLRVAAVDAWTGGRVCLAWLPEHSEQDIEQLLYNTGDCSGAVREGSGLGFIVYTKYYDADLRTLAMMGKAVEGLVGYARERVSGELSDKEILINKKGEVAVDWVAASKVGRREKKKLFFLHTKKKEVVVFVLVGRGLLENDALVRRCCAFWCPDAVLPPATATAVKKTIVGGNNCGDRDYSWNPRTISFCGFHRSPQRVDVDGGKLTELLGMFEGYVRSGGGTAVQQREHCRTVDFDGYSVADAPRPVQELHRVLTVIASKILSTTIGLSSSVLRLTIYSRTTTHPTTPCPPHRDMSLLTLGTATHPGFSPPPTPPETTTIICFPGKLYTLLTGDPSHLHWVETPAGSPSRCSMNFFARPSPQTRFRNIETGETLSAHRILHVMNELPVGWRRVVMESP